MTDLPLSQSGKSALEVAIEAIKQAGEILLAYFPGEKKVRDKSKSNLVTEVDILSEKTIAKFLQNEYPAYPILSEELAPFTPVTGYTWIVDPLAGTNNYAFGIPLFCINIALVKDQDILLGVTYDPLRKELFQAEGGKGAYLNNSPIHVSNKASLETSLLSFDPGYEVSQGKKLLGLVARLWPGVHSLRSMGSSSIALAYVACGRVDLYVRSDLRPWDIASGILLVREAGGKVSDWQGGKASLHSKEIVAANTQLLQEFLNQLK
jgi:myo-inositol-1(or 4)-monophosphatase